MKFLIVVVLLGVNLYYWPRLTDQRPFKIEAYYPDEEAATAALYKLAPIGTDLRNVLSVMQESKIVLTTWSGLPLHEEYVLKTEDAAHVMFFHKTWETYLPCAMYGARVNVEYGTNEKVTGIFLSFGGGKCEAI
jgi:hypothetical protein